jgi:hypothetical protein
MTRWIKYGPNKAGALKRAAQKNTAASKGGRNKGGRSIISDQKPGARRAREFPTDANFPPRTAAKPRTFMPQHHAGS